MRRAKLNIGLIGAGNIVKQRHLPALKAMEDVRIVAVCNSTLESSRRFCAEHLPGAEPMEHWPQLVCREDVDAVGVRVVHVGSRHEGVQQRLDVLGFDDGSLQAALNFRSVAMTLRSMAGGRALSPGHLSIPILQVARNSPIRHDA